MPGRVLSKANENKIRAALDTLKSMLSFLEDDADDELEDEAQDDLGEVPASEAATLDIAYVPLREQALRADGTVALKIIQPGWGSSGFYPAEVLQRDGPSVFAAGLKGYWNHPTLREEAERPEGDLNHLAMELISNARWQDYGPEGPGLYADAKVFGPYQAAVNELAPHVGVSIRAMGRATQGEAEGRKGPIIQALDAARSIDFVTEPGAGGRIIQMFEAARSPRPRQDTEEESVDAKELQETVARLEQDNARMREAILLRDAREFVRNEVAGANVPDVTRTRLVETMSANPPTTEDGQLDRDAFRTRIGEAVTAEQEYLAQAAPSGRVVGMGAAPVVQGGEDVQKRLADAFARLGVK